MNTNDIKNKITKAAAKKGVELEFDPGVGVNGVISAQASFDAKTAYRIITKSASFPTVEEVLRSDERIYFFYENMHEILIDELSRLLFGLVPEGVRAEFTTSSMENTFAVDDAIERLLNGRFRKVRTAIKNYNKFN